MLRVRPLIFTTHFERTVAQLHGLGLSAQKNDGDWAEFDSGNGKIGVFREFPDEQSIVLAFELRDAAIFVRRTLADGTHAELDDTSTGPGASVTAPDGFTCELAASEDLRLAEADSPTAVTAIWRTPDPAAANKVLADIGAKFVQELAAGGALFRAKNGGFVATAAGAQNAVELAIKHGKLVTKFGAESES